MEVWHWMRAALYSSWCPKSFVLRLRLRWEWRESEPRWERHSAFVKQPVSAECVPQLPPRQLLQGGKESFQLLHSRPNAPAAGCSVDAHLINRPSAKKERKVTTTALWNSIRQLVSLRQIFTQKPSQLFSWSRQQTFH